MRREHRMDNQIKEMLIDHLPNRYEDTLACYDMWKYEDWKDTREDGTINGFISYFFLDFEHDMIITAATDNRFSKAQWRILRDTIVNRTKPLRIESDPSNKILHKAAASYGGKFFGREIFFGPPGTSYKEETYE